MKCASLARLQLVKLCERATRAVHQQAVVRAVATPDVVEVQKLDVCSIAWVVQSVIEVRDQHEARLPRLRHATAPALALKLEQGTSLSKQRNGCRRGRDLRSRKVDRKVHRSGPLLRDLTHGRECLRAWQRMR